MDLLKEFIDSGDLNEAMRCLKDLDVPHFSHELVYQVFCHCDYYCCCCCDDGYNLRKSNCKDDAKANKITLIFRGLFHVRFHLFGFKSGIDCVK